MFSEGSPLLAPVSDREFVSTGDKFWFYFSNSVSLTNCRRWHVRLGSLRNTCREFNVLLLHANAKIECELKQTFAQCKTFLGGTLLRSEALASGAGSLSLHDTRAYWLCSATTCARAAVSLTFLSFSLSCRSICLQQMGSGRLQRPSAFPARPKVRWSANLSHLQSQQALIMSGFVT